MNFFAHILRQSFARAGSTFFLWSSSAANASHGSLGGMKCIPVNNNSGIRCASSRLLLLALLAMVAILHFQNADAGTFPASFMYSSNVTGVRFTSVADVCAEHMNNWNTHGLYGITCASVDSIGESYVLDVPYHAFGPPTNNVQYTGTYPFNVNRAYYCTNTSDPPNSELTCNFPAPSIPSTEKNEGETCTKAANPINIGTARKFQAEADYVGTGTFPLIFRRYYNQVPSPLYSFQPEIPVNASSAPPHGLNTFSSNGQFFWPPPPVHFVTIYWHTNYDRQLHYSPHPTQPGASISRPDGKVYFYTLSASVWATDADTLGKLTWTTDASGNPTGWQYTNSDDEIETYSANGRLLSLTHRTALTQTLAYDGSGRLASVTDTFGRQLSFTFDASNRIQTLTDPLGGQYNFAYNPDGDLASMTYPDGKVRTYLYNEPAYTSGTSLPHTLTGITDENGVRFATWSYDTAGRAVSSEHAGGAEKVTIAYDSPSVGQTTVSDYKDSATTANTSRIYNLQTILGVVKSTGLSQSCSNGCGNSSAATTYDANGNVSSRTDFNGNKTTFAYDLTRNLETQRVEGLTSAGAATPSTRTISSEWHPTWRVIKRMAEPKRITSYVWNGDGGVFCSPVTTSGVMCSKIVTETTDANGSLGFGATAVVPANVRT